MRNQAVGEKSLAQRQWQVLALQMLAQKRHRVFRHHECLRHRTLGVFCVMAGILTGPPKHMAGTEESKPVIQIFANPQPGVESINFFSNHTPEHNNAGSLDKILPEEAVDWASELSGGWLERFANLVFGLMVKLKTGEAKISARSQRILTGSEMFRRPPVICIQESYDFAPRL